MSFPREAGIHYFQTVPEDYRAVAAAILQSRLLHVPKAREDFLPEILPASWHRVRH